MIEPFLRLFDRLDSLKKVLILALTIMTLVMGYLGYIAAKYADDAFLWNTTPQFIEAQLPCVLYRIKADFYMLGVRFPIPSDVDDDVYAFATTYVIDYRPDRKQFNKYCTSIIKAINSDVAENLLIPYHDPDARIPIQPR